MASLVLGVAGAVVGSFFGMPELGYAIGAAIGGAIDGPSGPDGPRLTDLKVQNSAYGAPIPIVYGTYRVAGNVIWADDFVEHEHEEGKGSGPSTYSYSCSFAVSLCEGVVGGVRRIWGDGKLIYDATPTDKITKIYFKANRYKFYPGDELQLPDPTIEADKGVGNVPAYRGQSYWVFTDLELEMFGNRIPNLTFEIVKSQVPVTRDPILYGDANAIAIDRGTGYVWALGDGGALRVYDPITMTLIKTLQLPGGAGGGSIYYNGGMMYVGNSGPMTNTVGGWAINTVSDMVTPIYMTEPANLEAGTWGGYYWPGLIVYNMGDPYMVGTNGLAGGVAWKPDGTYVGTFPSIAHNYLRPVELDASVLGLIVGAAAWIAVDEGLGMPRQLIWFPGTPAGGGGIANQQLAYDSVHHVWYWGMQGQNGIYRFLPQTGALELCVTLDTGVYGGCQGIAYDPDNNKLYVSDGGTWRSYTPTPWGATVPFKEGESFPGFGSFFFPQLDTRYVGQGVFASAGSGTLTYYSFANGFVATTKKVRVADIIVDVSQRCDAGNVDVTRITSETYGYAITTNMEGKAALEPLAQCYFFDMVESSGTLKYVQKGTAPVARIPVTDVVLENTTP